MKEVRVISGDRRRSVRRLVSRCPAEHRSDFDAVAVQVGQRGDRDRHPGRGAGQSPAHLATARST